MAFEITFLGTSSMVPTKDRNVQSIYVEYKGEGILIDCGEGTQRQMNIANINRLKVRKILITHWHGDHVSGLIGLIQTIGNTEEPKLLTIIGPEGTKKYMEHTLKSCAFDLQIDLNIEEHPVKEKTNIYENEDYYIEAAPMEHGIPCNAYSIVEKDKRKIDLKKLEEKGLKQGPKIGKLQRGETINYEGKKIKPEEVSHIEQGKKISFILDTLQNSNCEEIARNADLLICEATYASDKENKAEEYNHMTAEQAAIIANNADVKKLVLTHFSQRYKSVQDLQEEAKQTYPNTTMAYDFLKTRL